MGILYWTVSSLAMLLIAFSKAGFGGGPGILATPMMVAVSQPTTAIAVMLPIMIFCDIWCVAIYRKKCVWSKVFNLLVGFIIGLCIATFLLAKIPGHEVLLKKGIGVVSATFGLLYFILLRNKRIEKYVPQKKWFGVFMGATAGIVSTLAHAAGPLTAIYFLSQGQRKENFMGSIVVYSFIGNCLKVPSYLLSGTMTTATLSLTLPLLIATPLGILLGWYLNTKLSNANFQTGINLILIGIGAYLIFWS